MIIEEVIELFQNHNKVKFILDGEGESEYKTIEFKDIIEALEKQIPKKPILLTYLPLIQNGWEYGCPSCKLAVGVNSHSFDYTDEDEYCPSCGQKLDWD